MQIQQNPGVFLGLGPCVLGGRAFPVCSTAANLNERRVLSLSGENPAAAALIGNLDLHTSIGTQDYRGLRLSFRRRAATGVSLNGNYTISRCFGDNTTGGFPQLAQGPTNPDNPDADRGHCDQDRTHIGNLPVGVETPQFENAVASALASGWRLSGILNARSGSWLNITTGSDRALNGQRFQEQRVDQVSDDVFGDGLNTYLNRAAFAQPALGTFGNYERNSITGPGLLGDRHVAGQADRLRPTSQTHRAAPRGVQPAQQLQLGDPRPGAERRNLRARHVQHGRHADPAVRRQVRVLAAGCTSRGHARCMAPRYTFAQILRVRSRTLGGRR